MTLNASQSISYGLDFSNLQTIWLKISHIKKNYLLIISRSHPMQTDPLPIST